MQFDQCHEASETKSSHTVTHSPSSRSSSSTQRRTQLCVGCTGGMSVPSCTTTRTISKSACTHSDEPTLMHIRSSGSTSSCSYALQDHQQLKAFWNPATTKRTSTRNRRTSSRRCVTGSSYGSRKCQQITNAHAVQFTSSRRILRGSRYSARSVSRVVHQTSAHLDPEQVQKNQKKNVWLRNRGQSAVVDRSAAHTPSSGRWRRSIVTCVINKHETAGIHHFSVPRREAGADRAGDDDRRPASANA